VEGSPEWEVLYRKFYEEEEVKKRTEVMSFVSEVSDEEVKRERSIARTLRAKAPVEEKVLLRKMLLRNAQVLPKETYNGPPSAYH